MNYLILILALILILDLNKGIFFESRKLGYSGWFLLLVSLIFSLCTSPLYGSLAILCFVAALPNRKLDEQRAKEMKLLEKQLQQAGIRRKQRQSSSFSDETIGDLSTQRTNETIGDDETIY